MESANRLAVVMFTDLVGYTALMGSDTDKALAELKASRALQQKLVRQHKGEWLKEMGDGSMCMFGSARQAVYCAIAIQQAVKGTIILPLRIGIHLGDVSIQGEDIFGDGVNIAARLETKCIPGGVLISDTVYQAMRGSNIKTVDRGKLTLKNVDQYIQAYEVAEPQLKTSKLVSGSKANLPMTRKGVYAMVSVVLVIILSWFLWGREYQSTTAASGEDRLMSNSIAVLPFTDLSVQQDQAYLADGLAEEIINTLTTVDGLTVIGRTSSFSFRDQSLDLKTIGERLGASLILEGSLKRNKNQIRVSTQLIQAHDGTLLWTEPYDRKMDDIFILQDEIAKKVTEKLKLGLELSQSSDPPTRNLEAYEAYLKGHYEAGKGLAGTDIARTYLEKAIRLDSNFVEPYMDLANVFWRIALYGQGDRSTYKDLTKLAIERVIQIDPTYFEAYGFLSFINFTSDWDWDAYRRNFQKAVELGLPLPNANHCMFLLASQGENDQVNSDFIAGIMQQLQKDPLSPLLLSNLTRAYLMTRQYYEVIRHGQEALEIVPDNTSIMRHMGQAYLSLGDYEQAVFYFEKLWNIDSMYAPQGYIGALVNLGRKTEAKEAFRSVEPYLSSFKKGISYGYLNSMDSAFLYVNKAISEKDIYCAFMKIDQSWDIFRSDPRYQELEARMNFPKIEKILN